MRHEQCPRCGNFKLLWWGRGFLLAVIVGGMCLAGLFTFGISLLLIPFGIIAAFFIKEKYKCRSCKAEFTKEEYNTWLMEEFKKRKKGTPTT